jgi:hypothetical protein
MYRFGESVRGLGQELNQTALFLSEQKSRDEVTDIHVQMAKANADWTVHLNERAQTAKPGDETFAPKFLAEFDNYLGAGGNGGSRAFSPPSNEGGAFL